MAEYKALPEADPALNEAPRFNPAQPDAGAAELKEEQLVKKRFDYAEVESAPDSNFSKAFLSHLVIFPAVACYYGLKIATESGRGPAAMRAVAVTTSGFDVSSVLRALGLVAIVSLTAAAASFAYLRLMRRYMKVVMQVTYGIALAVVVLVCGSVIVLSRSGPIACVMLFMAGSCCYYGWSIRNRMPFANSILASSCSALEAHSAPYYISYGVALAQVVWFALWVLGATTIWFGIGVTSEADARMPKYLGASFALLVSLFWTLQVLGNIAHTTTAGVVASWWLLPPAKTASVAAGALKRSVTSSLGSICFGSLIVGGIQAVKATLHLFDGKDGERTLLQHVAHGMLQFIEDSANFYNTYVYSFIAISGESFGDGSKKTFALFQRKGFVLLVNNDLTHVPLYVGALLVGLCSSLASYVCVPMLFANAKSDDLFCTSFGAFVLGFIIAGTAMSAVSSAVATTFVLWAACPRELEGAHPASARSINEAYELAFGDELRAAGIVGGAAAAAAALIAALPAAPAADNPAAPAAAAPAPAVDQAQEA